MNWQLIIVAVLIATAAGVLLRRALRWIRPATGPSSSCGSCSSCGSAANPPVVTLDSFDRPAKP